MSRKNPLLNLGVIIGTLGLIAGIILIFSDNWTTGLFGAIASGGVAFMSYRDSKTAD